VWKIASDRAKLCRSFFVKHKISFKKKVKKDRIVFIQKRAVKYSNFAWPTDLSVVTIDRKKSKSGYLSQNPLLNCRYFLPPIDIMLFCFVHKKQMKNDEIASIYSI
jgi:hypothetical protein